LGQDHRAINPGHWRYVTVTHGQLPAQLKPHDSGDPGDLQAGDRGEVQPGSGPQLPT
jgi:hypothetical protein